MTSVPQLSSQTLDWHKFEEKEDGSHILVMPEYYSKLFENQYPNIMVKSNTGWRETKSGINMFAFFKGLSVEDFETIKHFLEDYEKLVVIGINENLTPYFGDELDSCIDLDYHFTHGVRSVIGELEYRAKYKKSWFAIRKLAKLLAMNIHKLPIANSVTAPLLTYIPVYGDQQFHLAKKLATKTFNYIKRKNILSESISFIEPSLTEEKPKLKNTKVAEKFSIWENIIENDRITLLDSVGDRTVIIIDDLYQSGTTIWSFAKFLKARGAKSVHGIICVKTRGDTDNL